MATPDGIDEARVTTWLLDRADLAVPFTFELVQGGRSNLTYTVTDAAGVRVVLRRPPLHGVLQSAHDVGREHRIVAALAASQVPVPPLVGYEPDDSVTGAPFYVMRFVDGVVVRDSDAARGLEPAVRHAAAEDLVDVLGRLHGTDPDAVGLGELGRREGYIARQLARWHKQLTAGRTRELPLLDEVHGRLAAAVPVQGPATIVHGDYRLDNVIVDPHTGEVQAVLDWELTTLGDPLADVGLLQCYWSQPGDVTVPLLDSPTVVDGFPTRGDVAQRYAAATGRDLSELQYYVAFGYWKLACILEGVYTRFSAGAYGDADADASFRAFGEVVVQLAERAAAAATEAGR